MSELSKFMLSAFYRIHPVASSAMHRPTTAVHRGTASISFQDVTEMSNATRRLWSCKVWTPPKKYFRTKMQHFGTSYTVEHNLRPKFAFCTQQGVQSPFLSSPFRLPSLLHAFPRLPALSFPTRNTAKHFVDRCECGHSIDDKHIIVYFRTKLRHQL